MWAEKNAYVNQVLLDTFATFTSQTNLQVIYFISKVLNSIVITIQECQQQKYVKTPYDPYMPQKNKYLLLKILNL